MCLITQRLFLPVRFLVAFAFAACVFSPPAQAQLSDNLTKLFQRVESSEFRSRKRDLSSGQWVHGGAARERVERNPAGGDEIVRYDTATGKRHVWMSVEQLTPPQLGKPLTGFRYSSTTNGSVFLFAVNPTQVAVRNTGYEYWVTDRSKRSWRKLGGAGKSPLLNARLSPNGDSVAYTRDNNLYVENVATGKIKSLTRDGSKLLMNGVLDWVYQEEFELRDAFKWSPDGKRIAYMQFDETSVPEFALINYTDSLYPKITKYPYPKAGQTNPAVRVGIVNVSGGKTHWVETPGDARNNYIPRIEWTPDSRELLVQRLNRRQNLDLFLLASAKTGKTREMFRDHDDAWLDINDDVFWIEHGARALFLSERDGWRHAYSAAHDGRLQLITSGPFDVLRALAVDEAAGWFYYTASPDNPTQSYLYRSRLDGSSKAERVTPQSTPGFHTYSMSPDCRYALHHHSKFDSPGLDELVRLPTHDTVHVLRDDPAVSEKIGTYMKDRFEFVKADAGDSIQLDGWIIRPSKFDASKKYPVIVYVYGEPFASTVTDNWSARHLTYAALADVGYLVVSFDNRGVNTPKGRDWRKAVYGCIGDLSSKEQTAALRSLAKSHPYVDLTRVGVHGWSGGGSMTMNLMFRSPDLYSVGVAGAGVPDETLYDSIYQERYMGLPQENPEGYRLGSPINFAQNLKGKLLIVHGTGDDNVHFQGTQRLLNKLIENNKQFSFMEYPNRSHGIGGNHLQTLTYGFFETHLPAGPR
jgi:dipeptidyl-peptidase 4